MSYSFLRVTEGDGLNFPAGWLGSISSGLGNWFAVVGEVSGGYKTYSDGDSLWLHTFQAGARVSTRAGSRVRPFGQFLLGGANARAAEGAGNRESETNFSIEPGGGVDVPIGGRMSARIAVGFPMVFLDEGEILNTVRVVTGFVVGIGNR